MASAVERWVVAQMMMVSMKMSRCLGAATQQALVGWHRCKSPVTEARVTSLPLLPAGQLSHALINPT